MRTFFLGLCLLSLTSGAWADCRYFRAHTHLVSCEPSSDKDFPMPDYQTNDLDTPEVPSDPAKAQAKVICSCDYSLSGSNPLCDFDKTQENAYPQSSDDIHSLCLHATTLCDKLCPPDL